MNEIELTSILSSITLALGILALFSPMSSLCLIRLNSWFLTILGSSGLFYLFSSFMLELSWFEVSDDDSEFSELSEDDDYFPSSSLEDELWLSEAFDSEEDEEELEGLRCFVFFKGTFRSSLPIAFFSGLPFWGCEVLVFTFVSALGAATLPTPFFGSDDFTTIGSH